MKRFAVIALLLMCASVVMAQSYVEIHKAPYCRTFYGGASFAAVDSHYVWNRAGWVKVTIALDTTAGTTTAYFAANGDTTNALKLTYGIGGEWGATRTHMFKDLMYFEIKGSVPVETTVE